MLRGMNCPAARNLVVTGARSKVVSQPGVSAYPQFIKYSNSITRRCILYYVVLAAIYGYTESVFTACPLRITVRVWPWPSVAGRHRMDGSYFEETFRFLVPIP